jgi:uncharacterized protein
MRLRLLAAALLCAGSAIGFVAAPAAAAGPAANCAGLPKHSNLPVVDTANVVAPEAEAWLTADLMRHHLSGNEAIVAVTVPTLGGDDISSYAKRLFDCWGIGDEAADDGVLILVAMRERRVRIELGAGLDGEMTEEQLSIAIESMTAPLRKGDVAGALRSAADRVAADLGGQLPNTKAGIDTGTLIPTPDPGDIDDNTSVPLPDGFPFENFPDASPFGDIEKTSGWLLGAIPVLVIIGIVTAVLRAVGRGGAAFGGGAWRGGFPGGGSTGWGSPTSFHHGAWHDNDSSSFSSPSSGSSFGSSSSSGSSGGSGGSSGSSSSFGGGSSGGGGASGSW